MPESPNVIINRKNASVVLHFTANTANVVIVGNSSVSNIAKPGEIVNGASIAQAIFGSPSGNAAHWIVVQCNEHCAAGSARTKRRQLFFATQARRCDER